VIVPLRSSMTFPMNASSFAPSRGGASIVDIGLPPFDPCIADIRRRSRKGAASLHRLECRERLAGGLLLGVLLRPAAALAHLLAVDQCCAPESPLVRRALDLDNGVDDVLLAPREHLLELRLVVDVLRRR